MWNIQSVFLIFLYLQHEKSFDRKKLVKTGQNSFHAVGGLNLVLTSVNRTVQPCLALLSGSKLWLNLLIHYQTSYTLAKLCIDILTRLMYMT